MAELAYLITAHRAPEQLALLLDAVYSPRNVYLVHVDACGDRWCYERAAGFAARHDNVRLMARTAMVWGGYSQVQVFLDGLAWLLAWDQQWRHFINLSGQCLPLRSQAEITSCLAMHPERNHVLIAEASFEQEPFLQERVAHFHVEDHRSHAVVIVPEAQPGPTAPDGWRLRYGSNWCILSRRFCQYLCLAPELLPLKMFLRHTLCPDETFAPTALAGSPFAETWCPDYKRELYFPPGSASPAVFTMADLPRLRQSSAFFARKFDTEVDREIVRETAKTGSWQRMSEIVR